MNENLLRTYSMIQNMESDGNVSGNPIPQNNENNASVGQENQASQSLDVNEIAKRLEQMEKGYKSISSNYDKLKNENDVLQNKLKKKEQENLSEKQLKEIQEQEMKQELEKQKNELLKEKFNFEKTKLVAEKKWEVELIGRLTGNDIDEFSENVEWLNKFIEKEVEKKVNDRIAKVSSQQQTTSSTKKVNGEDIYTIEELKKLSVKENKDNMEKVMRSFKFHGYYK